MADLDQIQLPNGNTYNFVDTEGRKEENLVWGGTNKVGEVSPIGMSLSNEHSANRLAYINGDSLYFEYSSNSGSTWTSYDYTSTVKSQLCTLSYQVPIGRSSSSTNYSTSSRTRITLTAQNGTTGYVYTNPRKMLINISSSGSMQVLVEYRTGVNYQSSGAWSTFGTYNLSGWSGWNDIPLILGTLGGGTSQTNNNWQLRLTFIMTSFNSSYPTAAFVNSIRIYGENGWTTTSNLGATGHLYSYDNGQNAIFPANVQIKNGKQVSWLSATPTSGQVIVADGTGGGIKTSGYTIEKSVPSNAVFTDNNTTYTFANGTNGFTVTPSGGSAQTVTVTPSITNNVTGSGTSGYIAKFNGANTITNGPAIGSGTTKYLREDGTWQTPPSSSDTTYTIGTSGNNITLTPSSGSVQSITAPYATSAGSAASATSATSATTASKLGSSNVGSATNPIYLNGGTATACTYSLNKTVPSDAVFTDTTYSSLPAASGGTSLSLVTTGEKYTWNNGCTDTKVTQTADNSTNSDFPILFAGTADDTTRTEGAKKSARIAYNPKSSSLRFKSSAGISYTDITNGQIALSATDRETGEVSVCTIINPSVIVLGNQDSGDPLLTIYATSDGGVVLADRVDCNTMLVSDISEDYIPSKTSGNWSIGSDDGVYRIKAYRMGNLVQMTIAFHGNGSAVSSGSNGFIGAITGGALPVSQITLNGFYSSSILAATLDTDGSLTVRPFSASCTLSSASRAYLTGTFICE